MPKKKSPDVKALKIRNPQGLFSAGKRWTRVGKTWNNISALMLHLRNPHPDYSGCVVVEANYTTRQFEEYPADVLVTRSGELLKKAEISKCEKMMDYLLKEHDRNKQAQNYGDAARAAQRFWTHKHRWEMVTGKAWFGNVPRSS